MTNSKSMTEVAFKLLEKKKNPVKFTKMWDEVSQILGYNQEASDKKISHFHTLLTLDGRFVCLGDNKWDLRSRYKFEKYKVDIDVIDDEDIDEKLAIKDPTIKADQFGDYDGEEPAEEEEMF